MSVKKASHQFNMMSMCFGQVTENKVPESRIIKVEPREIFPYIQADLATMENKVQIEGNFNGQLEYSETATTQNYTEAEYFDLTTNRAYPPDVVKGEQVILFKYSDSEKYYWFSAGRDDKHRHTERIRFQVADEKKTVKELTDDNTYYFEMDTLHNKHIAIRTSKTDEEKFRYLFKFDAKEDTIHMCDDDNNELLLESKVPRWLIKNKNGSFTDINKNNIVHCAVEDIVLRAGRQIIQETPVVTEGNSTGDQVTAHHNKSTGFNSSDTFSAKAPCIHLDGNVVCETLVAKHIQSEDYSTGPHKPYTNPTTDIENGSATPGSNTPYFGNSDTSGNRHCVAWEDFMQFAELICASISCNCAHTGCPDNTSAALQSAASSIMQRNHGE